jgi:molybdopterin synthase sulfur carrier subunit
MPIQIKIPSPLRSLVDNRDTVSVEAPTVGAALNQLIAIAPGIAPRLFKSGAVAPTLNRFVNIYVNDEDIRFMQSLETPLKESDVISIVPAIAGGRMKTIQDRR